MKFTQCKYILLALLFKFFCAGAVRSGFLLRARAVDQSADEHVADAHGVGSGAGAGGETQKSAGKVTLHSTVEAMVGQMVQGMMQNKGPSIGDIVNMAHGKMDITEAVRQLNGKLPDDVAALVRLTGSADSSTSARGNLDEDSLQKARKILNGMMLSAWGELDDVVFECKEFQERNRGTYEQVVADLARLGSQLAKLGEARVSSSAGIARQDGKRKQAEDILEKVTSQFTATRFENSREMSIRKNDLAVFDFILNATACKESSFVQLNSEQPKFQVCNTKDGLTLNFQDSRLQAKVERMMTPDARQALREALGQVQDKASFVDVHQTSKDVNESTTALPTFAASVVPVKEAPHPDGQWKKCVDGAPNCGLLHDLMSLEWGKFRDSFDELTAEMNNNQQQFDASKKNLNDELTVINDEKTKFMEILANTISNINADTEENNGKNEQKRDLTREFDTKCAIFRDKITEILFTKICAVRKVRNELLVHSTLTPPSNLSDCDVSSWVSKTGECIGLSGAAILCDDTCPNLDPYKCGGIETMKRDVVVVADANGMKCPRLERTKRCGQKKCPVDCLMSEWSGWSKCTRECEGGVEAKTRSILTKPKNGGIGCDSVQEDRPCNTGSCDRDCSLAAWSEWEPCSMACGGGMTSRLKKVLVPIRGLGKCPKLNAATRLNQKRCNTQACVGDEICVAKQDLIIALDASGSLKEDGFAILQQFTANLTLRYRSEYFGAEAMKIGVALFGNGHLLTLPDGTTSIAPAINVQGLTNDLALVRSKISALKWARGFTNMAQGLSLADTMLSQGGRSGAQSAVLVLSDGKYSFKYQTAEKAQELKDKNIMILMAPVTESKGSELEVLKSWATQPWEANYERIPGLEALKYNPEIFASKLIARFCSDAASPAQLISKENQLQFMKVHEGGYPDDTCGKRTKIGKLSKDDCAAKARDSGLLAFAYGTGSVDGLCETSAMMVTADLYAFWKNNREQPECPTGKYESNPFYDTYVINPKTVGTPTIR